ncbi:MAG TPA: head GIN domain-containing protein [Burkholderiaceae bacterium]
MRTALTLSLAAAAALFTIHAQAADQTRSVAPFSAVSNSGPINLVIEVGKAQSVVVSGSDDYLEDVRTEVIGDELRIKMHDDSHIDNRHWNDMKVTVTVPKLTAFTMGGAGATTITHVSGDSLDIRFGGAGSLKADGSVKTLRLNVGGVGSIDLHDLHADVADVKLGGVGSVKVWATQTLDASVGGVGSLTYYGEPKQVNTHGGGLGSISKGK